MRLSFEFFQNQHTSSDPNRDRPCTECSHMATATHFEQNSCCRSTLLFKVSGWTFTALCDKGPLLNFNRTFAL